MFIKRTTRRINGKPYFNHLLVESVATPRGPRHRVICSLGALTPASQEHWAGLAQKLHAALAGQTTLLPDAKLDALAARVRPSRRAPRPDADDVVAVHTDNVQTEEAREAGPVHVGHQMWRALTLDEILAQAGLPERARRLAQRCLRAADALYHARHRLRPVGEVLYVGRARYRGPVMEFPDGTRLAPGDFIGTLHFNNARFLKIEAGSPERASLQFARLMLQSMGTLADRARLDPLLADLPAFQGISWFKPHGRRVGFITAPFPDGLRKRIITAYFRLLVWAFAPAARTRAAARPTPTVYWLTREQLLGHHGKADDQEENRT